MTSKFNYPANASSHMEQDIHDIKTIIQTTGVIISSAPLTSSNITEIGGSAITLGQKTSANSLPIVLASNQSSIPVTNAGTFAVQDSSAESSLTSLATSVQNPAGVHGRLQINVDQFGGQSLSPGQTTMSASVPIAIASNQTNIPTNLSQIGSVDFAQGRRISDGSVSMVQSSDSWNATDLNKVGGSIFGLGQSTMVNSLGVAIAFDQSSIPANCDVNKVGGSIFGLGQSTMVNSLGVAIAFDQSSIPANCDVNKFGGANVVLGSAASVNCIPTVIASDQSTINVSDATTHTNTATTATNTSTIAGAITSSIMQNNIAQLNGVTIAMNAGTVSTGTQRVTMATDQGKITSQLPAALGQTTMSASTSVCLASNQSTVPVSLSGSQSVNIVQVAGSAIAAGMGSSSAQTIRVSQSLDSLEKYNITKFLSAPFKSYTVHGRIALSGASTAYKTVSFDATLAVGNATGNSTFKLASSSNLDTQTIYLYGHNASGTVMTESIVLTGQTVVTTVNSYNSISQCRLAAPAVVNGTIYCSDSSSYTAGVPNARAWACINSGAISNADITWWRAIGTGNHLVVNNLYVSSYGGSLNHTLLLCCNSGASSTSIGATTREVLKTWSVPALSNLIFATDGWISNNTGQADTFWFEVVPSAADVVTVCDITCTYTFC